MWSDVLTKPKIEACIKDMRSVLMNMPTNYDDAEGAKKTYPDLLLVVEKVESKFR